MGLDENIVTQQASLPQDELEALNAAVEASKFAYAPYSKYKVGAALILENGTVIHGSNQENIAYPSGLCAERTALFAYGASGRKSNIKILAIAAVEKNGDHSATCSPCGSCRQVMVEYEKLQKEPYKVIFYYEGKIEVLDSSVSLMPFPFHF